MKYFNLVLLCLIMVCYAFCQETNDRSNQLDIRLCFSGASSNGNISDYSAGNSEIPLSSKPYISIFGQDEPKNTLDYYQRLYYTCKVWGFVKYFHSETANCSINLDSILMQKLPLLEVAPNNDQFNQILLDLINSPGETEIPTVPPPFIPDSLTYNLDLVWLNDDVFSQPVKDALDTISIRFRPRTHCLVGEAFAGGNPAFNTDIMYNSLSGVYPEVNKRILALFRYWNILNYFFPYKNLMDQNWDTTLVETIPLFIEASTSTEYDLAIMKIAKRINDSHAFTSGGVTSSIYGTNYPRFDCRYIENETVITRVHSSVPDLKAGDIIRAMDGLDIGYLRDSIETYTHGSNDPAIMSNVHKDILNGPYGSFEITIENETGVYQYTKQRDFSASQFYSLQQNTGPVWYDTTINQTCTFGYVDMGRLTTAQVGTMMTELWNTDGIIFDIRSYPQGTLWTLVNYLFSHPIHIANFTTPDIHYPGVLSWLNAVIGGYSSEAYQGKVIILFDINTISQAEYTVMGLEQHAGSIKIGSQTMAADGDVSIISLPGYITSYFTGLGTFYPDYSPTQRIGIVPDIEIWSTIEGIRQGKDEVLEYALNCNLVGIEKPFFQNTDLCLIPNPVVNSSQLKYQNQNHSKVLITFHDINGRLISVIADQVQQAGNYSIDIDGSNLKAGTYLIRFTNEVTFKVVKLVKLQ